MQLVHARRPLPDETRSIFLAGPTPRDATTPSWRPEALRLLGGLGFDGAVFVPEDPEGGMRPGYGEEQVYWEWEALDRAAVIAFWVPRDLRALPGFTTNVEFGVYCSSGRALLGFPPGAPKTKYLAMLARRHAVPVVHTLAELLQMAVDRVR